MQDQESNKPGDDEFFEDEFGEFETFDENGQEESFSAYDAAEEHAGDPATDDLDDPFSTEEWDDGYTDETATETTGGKSRGGGGLKNLSFNTMVIGAAVVVGLGVLGYQVLTTPAPSSGVSRFQSALDFTGSQDGVVLGEQATDDQPAPVAEQTPPATTEDAGFLNNPGVLDGLAQESADAGAPPMPSPISNDMDNQGVTQEANAHGDVLTPLPDKPEISFDESQAVPRSPQDPVTEGVDAVAGTETETETDNAPPTSSAMDVIRQAQDQRQQKENAPPAEEAPSPVTPDPETVVAEEPAPESEPEITPDPEEITPPEVVKNTAPEEPAPVVAPVADSAQTDIVVKKLEELSDRLSVMEQQIVQIRESGQADLQGVEKEIAALKNGLGDVASPAKPAAEKIVVKKAPVKQAEPKATEKPKPKKQATAAASSSAKWELRAAQPGRAWVSRQGEREMQSISPGDTLSGIGQVVRIDYAGGRWVVVGTQGEIRQ